MSMSSAGTRARERPDVVLGGRAPTAVQQQSTREVRQFETVFVGDADLASRTARLRVFTEDEELGFAADPILGAGAVLHSLLSPAGDAEIWALQLGSGTVTVGPEDRSAGSRRRWIRAPSSLETLSPANWPTATAGRSG